MGRKPNVLFLFTDDQRFDTIAALGNEHIHTPNLDDLVRNGVTFTRAHIMGGTCAAVCMPSRAMLMTGKTLFHLHGEGQRKGATIPKIHMTLPEVFRDSGYYAYHIGKWHQDKNSFNRSFDNGDCIFGFTKNWYETYGGHWNVAIHDYDPTGKYQEEKGYIMAEDKVTRLPIGVGVGGVHSSELFCDAAVNFIKNYREDKPFFMYLSFVAPHDPRHSPDEYEEMYPADNIPLPPNYMPRHPFDNGELIVRDEALEAWPRRKQAIKEHIADYYAMISHIDANIGRVISELKRTGQYENTIIVFAGDNGLAVGQHGLLGKQNLYDHSVRVPLIISGPNIPKDKKSEAYCYLFDLFPTLCDICEMPVPKSVEGVSLKPVIDTKKDKVRDFVFCAYRNYQRAIRNDTFKLIEYYVDGFRYRQLFNIEVDPYELHNLVDNPKYYDILNILGERLEYEQIKADDPLLCKTKKELATNIW